MLQYESTSTRRAYNADLNKLKNLLTNMGEMAQKAVERSMTAFISRDLKLADRVMMEDDLLDDMAIKIEDCCLILTAKQQPIAHDLRVISTGVKISIDWERIGDNAYDIAKATHFMGNKAKVKVDNLEKISQQAQEMLRSAVQAYEQGDIALAEEICHKEKAVNDLFKATFKELSEFVTDDVEMAKQATEILFICRFLKRIANHAANIAEAIIFLETAERPPR